MGLLSGLSAVASGMPRELSIPLALLAAAEGLRHSRRERSRPVMAIVLGATPTVDGAPVSELTVQWRGPLAFMRFRGADRRWQRLAWWPDTLDAAGRRELRLAVPVQATAYSQH